MPEFIVKIENREVQRVILEKDTITIGRGKDNDIVLENLSVSRYHAQVTRENGQYVIRDLDSSNGTYVNGVRFSRTQVYHNDKILIGKHTLVFVAPEAGSPNLPGPDWQGTMILTAAQTPGSLVVFFQKQRPQLCSLASPPVRIGRARDNALRVTDWFVDERHAVIEGADAGMGCTIRRLSETCPLFVNGKEVEQAILREGDVVQLGNTQMLYTKREVTEAEMEEMRLPPPAALLPGGPSEGAAHAPCAPPPGAEEQALAADSEDEPTLRRKEWAREDRAYEFGAADEGPAGEPSEEEAGGEPSEEEAGGSAELGRLEPLPDELAEILSEDLGAAPLEEATDEVESLGALRRAPTTAEEELEVDFAPEPSLRDLRLQEDLTLEESPAIFGLEETRPPAPAGAEEMEEGAWPAEIAARESAARVDMGDETTDSPPPAATTGGAEEEVPSAAPTAAADPALIARLEQALGNRSVAVRRQAARQLKELTGRDYDAQGANAQGASV